MSHEWDSISDSDLFDQATNSMHMSNGLKKSGNYSCMHDLLCYYRKEHKVALQKHRCVFEIKLSPGHRPKVSTQTIGWD